MMNTSDTHTPLGFDIKQLSDLLLKQGIIPTPIRALLREDILGEGLQLGPEYGWIIDIEPLPGKPSTGRRRGISYSTLHGYRDWTPCPVVAQTSCDSIRSVLKALDTGVRQLPAICGMSSTNMLSAVSSRHVGYLKSKEIDLPVCEELAVSIHLDGSPEINISHCFVVRDQSGRVYAVAVYPWGAEICSVKELEDSLAFSTKVLKDVMAARTLLFTNYVVEA